MPAATLNDKVYNKIKKDIMSLELEPGAAVSVQKLADSYGSSRTPVREAVVRLQQEGLVIIYPQAGTNISPISSNRIQQERFVLSSLVLSMVNGFVKNCSVLVTDTLTNVIGIQKRAATRGNLPEFFAMDNRFNKIMFETAQEHLAYSLITSSNTHYSRLRYLRLLHYGIDAGLTQMYEGIVELAKQRNEEGMKHLLTQHLHLDFGEVKQLQEIYRTYFME